VTFFYSDNFTVLFVPLIIIFTVILLSIAFVIWTLVDLLRNEFTGYNKIIWLLTIIMLPPLGSILYIFIGRKQKTAPEKGELDG
jgi:hypothetical protein